MKISLKQFQRWSLFVAFMLAGCTAAEIVVETPPEVGDTGIDSAVWVEVPAGDFYQGPLSKEMAVDFDYQIMLTDVTNQQYADYLNVALSGGSIEISDDQIVGYYAGDAFNAYEHELEIPEGDWIHMPLNEPPIQVSYDGTSFVPLPGYETHPMVMVTWFGARAYCEFQGGRLPTEIEWEKAARGTDDRPYPWGSEISPNNANYYHSRDPFDKLYNGYGGTTPVGFYNGNMYAGYQTVDSTSPYGLYDMAGNVWQWTGDVYPDTHMRYMRGGSRGSYEPDLRVWAQNSAGPDYFSTNVGFRCTRDMLE
jgi:formylglycine-generating enzyme